MKKLIRDRNTDSRTWTVISLVLSLFSCPEIKSRLFMSDLVLPLANNSLLCTHTVHVYVNHVC